MTSERIENLESTVAAHETGLRFLYKVLQARIDAAQVTQEEVKALVPDNRADDLDNDTTNAGSVKIFPPAIEDELDALPPHEGHGGAV